MNQFLFCLSVIPRQEVEWAQISKNDMLRKKRLAFSIHSEWSDSDMLWILEEKCKRISRTRPWYIPCWVSTHVSIIFYLCKVFHSPNTLHSPPYLPNWKQEKACVLYHTFYYIVEDSFVKKLMACLCNVCIYITLYVVVRTYGQNHVYYHDQKNFKHVGIKMEYLMHKK